MPNEPHDDETPAVSRRRFLALAGSAAAAAPLLGTLPADASTPDPSPAPRAPRPKAKAGRRPNILFVFTDQERDIAKWPDGLRLPAHERLARTGVRFANHYCPAVMCTSSRSVMLTGLQTPDNGMFENADMPYTKPLSTKVPTIGHLLRRAGYRTAYKGKWHLDHEFDTRTPDGRFAERMDAWGFSDFDVPVDGRAHALGGYRNDQLIAGSALGWLRETGRELADDGTPWALFVSLVNPHDIMYLNTDAAGERVQDDGRLLMRSARVPDHADYRTRWNAPLPSTLREALDAPGRPGAHREFARAWDYCLGRIPTEEARWDRFTDFYFNSIRSVDRQLASLLDELDALGLADDTAIVFTSDHGEMGGAHGLRGKGPMAFQEVIHLPMYVVHPDVKGGQRCASLTAHIDLVPTLLGMAGVDAPRAAEFAGRTLPGKDFSGLLAAPSTAPLHAVRDSILFTYSGLATNDSELIRLVTEGKAAGKDPKSAVRAAGYRPDFKKRGSLRTVFDGRHKFTRYFAPSERNSPKTLDDLVRWNDLELFDLEADPQETRNLALDRDRNRDLILAMSARLEAIIRSEIGVDDGREMPPFEGVDWSIDRIDL